MASFLRAAVLAITATACGPGYLVQQGTRVALPTAPPAAPMSGRGALDLGVAVATEVSPAVVSGSESGLATARVQPEGALSVRLTDFMLLRAYGSVGLPQGGEQVTGTIEAPYDSAWGGGIGPVLRLLAAERLLTMDIGVTGGFAALPSRLLITEYADCWGDDCEPSSTYAQHRYEVMPVFTLRADVGLRPAEWVSLRAGGTVRNQPTNDAAAIYGFITGPRSSVSAGPIGVVVHGALALDFSDEIGARVEVQWPVGFALTYAPIVTLAVQGRIGEPSRDEPIGVEL